MTLIIAITIIEKSDLHRHTLSDLLFLPMFSTRFIYLIFSSLQTLSFYHSLFLSFKSTGEVKRENCDLTVKNGVLKTFTELKGEKRFSRHKICHASDTFPSGIQMYVHCSQPSLEKENNCWQ